jgi:hypothetical protein
MAIPALAFSKVWPVDLAFEEFAGRRRFVILAVSI